MALTNPKVKSIFGLYIGEEDYVSDIFSFDLRSEPLPAERVTFSRYTEGRAVKWNLLVRARYDGGSEDSLHTYIWDHAGQEADFILKPFQDVDPNTKRSYSGTVRVPYRPDISVHSGRTSIYMFNFKVIGHPTRGDSPGGFLTEGYYDDY